jgi:UTP--glucose-1-phosphate uridylyltransferase
MTSFTTHKAILDWLKQWQSPVIQVTPFVQSVSVRLTLDGKVFSDDKGSPSLYSTGHGDVPFAFAHSGFLEPFMEGGGQTLMVSNIDNIAATIDPAIIGLHAALGKSISVEVADKHAGDKGGAPATIDGVAQIVEAFRFPKEFDQDRIPVFNTNTLYVNTDALQKPGPLTWFAATKSVDHRTCVQFERLIGEMTAFHSSVFIRVSRQGNESRFEPIKEVGDIQARSGQLKALLASRGLHSTRVK